MSERMTTRELLDSGITLGHVGRILAVNLAAVEAAIEMDDPEEERESEAVIEMRNELAEAREENARVYARIAIAHNSEREARAQRDEFKRLTHEALDAVGAPTDPGSVMGKGASGHRMVDRIRYLAASRDEWERAATHIGDRCTELRRQLDVATQEREEWHRASDLFRAQAVTAMHVRQNVRHALSQTTAIVTLHDRVTTAIAIIDAATVDQA